MWIFSNISFLLFGLGLISKNGSYFASRTECCELHSSINIGPCFMSETNEGFRNFVQSSSYLSYHYKS